MTTSREKENDSATWKDGGGKIKNISRIRKIKKGESPGSEGVEKKRKRGDGGVCVAFWGVGCGVGGGGELWGKVVWAIGNG